MHLLTLHIVQQIMKTEKKQSKTYSPRGVSPKPVWVRLLPEELAEVERRADEGFRSISAQVRLMVVNSINTTSESRS